MENKGANLWLVLVACASSVLAFSFPVLGGLIFLFPISIILLAKQSSLRLALYSSFIIGLITTAFHLFFFSGIFGVLAFPLWSVLGFWLALFSFAVNLAFKRFGSKAYFLMPFYWFFFEYFRSEVYFLKFSWLAPGMALSHPYWNFLASYGFYGSTFLILTLFSAIQVWKHARGYGLLLLVLFLTLVITVPAKHEALKKGPVITGVQLEHLNRGAVLKNLDILIAQHPETDIVVLSEYTFQNGVSEIFRTWCQKHRCYLVVGSTDPQDDQQFMNTVFVINPEGETVFKQGKSVPIQFFDDGVPATSQEVWNSPWGKIGIAICYDLAYTQVMDELVKKGAELLIIPTMDSADWGETQHKLHSFLSPVRAREYQVPIFRLASSGISQVVSGSGQVLSSAPFPGRGAIITGQLKFREAGGFIPVLRQFTWLIFTISILGFLFSLLPNGYRNKNLLRL